MSTRSLRHFLPLTAMMRSGNYLADYKADKIISSDGIWRIKTARHSHTERAANADRFRAGPIEVQTLGSFCPCE